MRDFLGKFKFGKLNEWEFFCKYPAPPRSKLNKAKNNQNISTSPQSVNKMSWHAANGKQSKFQ